MINLNTPTKLPSSFKWYGLVKMFVIFGLMASPFLFIGGVKVWSGIFVTLSMFLGIPIGLYFLISASMVYFIISEKQITVNSGILIKRSKSISFDKVQNVASESGVLARMFGLVKISIWTASPSQIEIKGGQTENRPDQVLYLENKDGEYVKNLILKR